MKWCLIFLPLFIYIWGMTWGYYLGIDSQKKIDLQHCKEAGWEFIEEKVFSKSMVRDTFYSTKEQQLQGLTYLQANIATKCILRIDK